MTNNAKTRIMIVDDHPAVREGLGYRISKQKDMTVSGDASNVNDALKKIAELQPDVVIVDIALKNSDGLDLLRSIKAKHRRVRTLVHSMFDETVYAERCLHAGAMGYVGKESDPNEVILAIRDAMEGRIHLSPAMANVMLGRAAGGAAWQSDPVEALTNRQLEIFRLMGEGNSAAQIAEKLCLSVHTIETHRDNIRQKLNLGSAAELVRYATLWVDKRR